VINRVEELRQLGLDGFKTKHGDIGEEFYDLATDYATAIELGQFISFDDMATQATALLKSNPEILDMYQFSYQYIMIDEFQDVSKDQAEFVYLLASGHHNLVAVGDDDQSIYRWRGACPSYMLDFPKQFNAPTVVFRDNFRSTAAIVNASQRVIRKNAERIDKDVVSSSGRDGDEPEVVHSTSPKDFQRVIGEMLDAGYHYGDIAIIARTNKTLKALNDALECPCQIARTFLRHDGFFNFVKAAMDLYADPDDAMAFSLFCAPFGLQDSAAVLCATGRQLELARETKEFEGVMAILDELFEAIRQVMAPKDFIAKAKKLVFWDKSDAPSVLLDEFRLQFPEGGDLGDLREYCRKVVEYLSEKRVNETPTDSVTLITNHDCKGLEYPVVLLHSDYSSDSAEERSLFYVALTRAKEKCVIFESKSAKVSFTADLLENNV
jgi:DNA helicase-2/ATP-dependent DNA helicase PcrA